MKKLLFLFLLVPNIALAQDVNNPFISLENNPENVSALNEKIEDIRLNKQNKLPYGTINMYGGTADPRGWFICDGRSLSKTTYYNLFKAIGTAYGTADSTHFNIPDMRGRFPRGADDPDGAGTKFSAASRDPNKATRTAMATGGNTGNNIGSVQTDTMQGHWHRIFDGSSEFACGGSVAAGSGGGNAIAVGTTLWGATLRTDGTNGTPRISPETRPVNAYVNYIIKY